MCGIFGFCRDSDLIREGFHAALLRSATSALAHRGPDAEGVLGITPQGMMLRDGELTNQELELGLGHRRLSILDLSATGRQPMAGPGGTCPNRWHGARTNWASTPLKPAGPMRSFKSAAASWNNAALRTGFSVGTPNWRACRHHAVGIPTISCSWQA